MTQKITPKPPTTKFKIRRYNKHARVDDGNVWHVAHNPLGMDCALCGIADEGLGEGNYSVKPFVEKDGLLRNVTCEQCLSLVRYCQTLN